jgi:hypothetical protein
MKYIQYQAIISHRNIEFNSMLLLLFAVHAQSQWRIGVGVSLGTSGCRTLFPIENIRKKDRRKRRKIQNKELKHPIKITSREYHVLQ